MLIRSGKRGCRRLSPHSLSFGASTICHLIQVSQSATAEMCQRRKYMSWAQVISRLIQRQTKSQQWCANSCQYTLSEQLQTRSNSSCCQQFTSGAVGSVFLCRGSEGARLRLCCRRPQEGKRVMRRWSRCISSITTSPGFTRPFGLLRRWLLAYPITFGWMRKLRRCRSRINTTRPARSHHAQRQESQTLEAAGFLLQPK
jgi:hypothetical protein